MDGLSKGTTPVFGAGALEQFDLVLSTAPRQYKLCQAAYAGRSESARAIGEGGGSDALRQWLWGRGTRFPGAYLGWMFYYIAPN